MGAIIAPEFRMGCGSSLLGSKPWTAADFERYDEIKNMWAKMDADNSGYIEIRELKLQLNKSGKQVGMDTVKLAFEKVDADRSGKISFDEFCKYNGLTITDEVRKNLDERGRAKFQEGETDVEARTDGRGHRVEKGKQTNNEDREDSQGKTKETAKEG